MTSVIDGAQRRAVNDRPALRRVIASSLDQFAAEHWGAVPALSTSRTVTGTGVYPWAPQSFDDLFSLEAADELLSVRGLRTPFLRVAKDGNVVPSSRFTRGGGVGATIADQVDTEAVAKAYADGATLVFQGLHRTWEPLSEFTAQLVADLGHPVQVNAYLTPPAAQGFSAHYDTHDVFVVQVAGRKHWTIHEPVLLLPSTDEPWDSRRAEVAARAQEHAHLDTELSPGDALYLPRGWLHAARSGAEPTLHLTFGVHPLTVRDVLRAAIDAHDDDPRLRASLPLGVDPDDSATFADSLTAAEAALRDVHVESATTGKALRAKLSRDTRPAPIRPIEQAAARAQVGPASRVRLRQHLRVQLTGNDLSLPDRTIPLPEGVSNAMEVLLTGASVSVIDLPGDVAASLALVAQLLAEAVLVPAD